MTIKAFSKKFDLSVEEMIDTFIEQEVFKANGTPKTKYIKNGWFDEDGNVVDSKAVKSWLEEEVWVEEEEEDDESYDDEDDEIEEDEEEFDEDESDEVTLDSIKDMIENFNGSKSEYAELINVLTEKLVNYVEENESEIEEEDDDLFDEDEEDDDEDEDPNAPGKYRGWTIEKKGITVTATKGKKSIKTSVKGNIREKIDELED